MDFALLLSCGRFCTCSWSAVDVRDANSGVYNYNYNVLDYIQHLMIIGIRLVFGCGRTGMAARVRAPVRGLGAVHC